MTITHRAGRVTVDDAAAVKLTGRGSDASVSNVRGDASFSMQSGELSASFIKGPIDVECQNADVELKKLDEAKGQLRVNAVGGSVTLEGLRGDARIDGRNTEIDIELVKAAAVAVYNEGDEPIEITAPAGGFVLDAHRERRPTEPARRHAQRVMSVGGDEAREQRANGAVRGGGPTITLRANHGDIIVRPHATTTNPER